jgi:hypothetical protein
MENPRPLFVGQTGRETEKLAVFLATHRIIFAVETDSGEKDLEALVHGVARSPSDLLTHLQRIYACYTSLKTEQLYAALIDLVTFLAGRGQSLAVRVIKGCIKQLDNHHYNQLLDHLADPCLNPLPATRYTIIKQDIIGTVQLVSKTEQQQSPQDIAQLVKDYIEYSQLDDAMDLLEKTVLSNPDEMTLQEQLLELYRSTNSKHRFRAMLNKLEANKLAVSCAWQQLEQDFTTRAEL